VHDDVGIAIGLAELDPEIQSREAPAGDRTHQHRLAWIEGIGGDPVDQAEPLEHPQRVGGELDADADLAELVGLLEHADRHALPRERQRGGQTTDATADDQRLDPLLPHAHRLHRPDDGSPILTV